MELPLDLTTSGLSAELWRECDGWKSGGSNRANWTRVLGVPGVPGEAWPSSVLEESAAYGSAAFCWDTLVYKFDGWLESVVGVSLSWPFILPAAGPSRVVARGAEGPSAPPATGGV